MLKFRESASEIHAEGAARCLALSATNRCTQVAGRKCRSDSDLTCFHSVRPRKSRREERFLNSTRNPRRVNLSTPATRFEFRATSDTDLAAVVNQSMRKIDPFFPRDKIHQVPFDLFCTVRLSQAEQFADPADMRVHDDAARDSKCRSQQHVGCLATDTRKFDKVFQSSRQLTLVIRDHRGGHSDQALGLIAKKAR